MAEEGPENERVVCATDDVPAEGAHVAEVDDVEVAVFNVDGEYYALNNVCPHQGGPLGDGKVEDECVYCPWHGWQFDVETGEHAHGLKTATSYSVTVRDDDVYVTL